jgi:hypothetical protein
LFGKAFRQNKRNGHTFATARQLCHAYYESIQWEERRYPSIAHLATILLLSKTKDDGSKVGHSACTSVAPLNVNSIKSLFEQLVPVAIRTKSVYCVNEPRTVAPTTTTTSVEGGDVPPTTTTATIIPTATTMEKVFYAGEDWVVQEYVTSYINQIAKRCWNVEQHADGCLTEADVEERIAQRQPPRFPDAGPQWHSEEFQKLWHDVLDPMQRKAVLNAALSPVTFITGRPGTGKTEVFRALSALFGGSVLPVAAYGRISRMLTDRLGMGYTFHRAEALVSHFNQKNRVVRGKRRSNEGEGGNGERREVVNNKDEKDGFAKTIKHLVMSNTLLIDEFGLVTHDHLRRVLTSCGGGKCRIIMAGDIDQKSAIGSGSIIQSLYGRYGSNPRLFSRLEIPHRFLPNYGLGMTLDEIRQLVATKPTRPDDPLCVPWNMQVVQDYATSKSEKLDLVVSTKPEVYPNARFTVLVRKSSGGGGGGGDDGDGGKRSNSKEDGMIDVLANLTRMGVADPMSTAVQHLAQTNLTRRAISTAVRRHHHYSNRTMEDGRGFEVGEKITFLKNKYFEIDGDSDDDEEGGGDNRGANDASDDIAADYQALRSDSIDDDVHEGQERMRSLLVDGDDDGALAPEPARKRPRTSTWRGHSSENVFNGDLKVIEGIYEVDASGAVLATVAHTKVTSGHGRNRMVAFSDETQLCLDQYDEGNIESGICLSSSKMQGSECDDIVDHFEPNTFTCRDEIYTNMTRARERYILVGEGSLRTVHEKLCETLKRQPRLRHECFARYLQIDRED